jgi:hypothetical protein
VCQKGVNADQTKIMIGQASDSLALSQQWLEQIHHLADHAGMDEPSAQVAQASVLIGEARAKLEAAAALVDDHASDTGASVELV